MKLENLHLQLPVFLSVGGEIQIKVVLLKAVVLRRISKVKLRCDAGWTKGCIFKELILID
jgi:hypothetical protein